MLEVPLLPSILREWGKGQTATDTVDRLNYFITTSIICFFALITSAKQFFGKPIQCWMSAEFEKGWEQYAEDYCFISNVYVQPEDQQFANRSQLTDNVRHTDHVSYYPWIPLVLCLQAMCFYFPHFFWKFVQKRTAIYPEAFLKEAGKLNKLTGEPRELELNRLTDYYMETVSMFGTASVSRRIPITPRSGRNATLLYLLTKIFYLLNIYTQIYMLSLFIGESYLHWGFESFFGILRGLQWKESSIFPRVVFCDFTIRRLGNLNPYTVQCVLMLNMINEKLYLFLFVWFIFLTMTTLADFIYYVLILTVPRFRKDLVLRTVDEWRRGVSGTNKRDIVDRFVDECLHPDGVLLLLFLSDHVGGRITYDLTNAMITRYNTEEGPVYKHNANIPQAPSVCPEEPDESCIVNAKSLLPTVSPYLRNPPHSPRC